MADQRCKRCGKSKDNWRHKHLTMIHKGKARHPFEPEDVAPFLPLPAQGIDNTPVAEAGARVAGFVQGPIEGNPPCHVCGIGMVRDLSMTADPKKAKSIWRCQSCGATTGCESVAQPGAGGEREYSPTTPHIDRGGFAVPELVGSTSRCDRPRIPGPADIPCCLPRGHEGFCRPDYKHETRKAEPAAGQGAEQFWPTWWKENFPGTITFLPRPNAIKFAEAYAAHVTKGLEARLAEAQETIRCLDRSLVLTVQSHQGRTEAAEARNLELMGELQAYKDACGDLSPSDLEKLLDKRYEAMGIAELGDMAGYALKIESLESRLAEAAKELEEYRQQEQTEGLLKLRLAEAEKALQEFVFKATKRGWMVAQDEECREIVKRARAALKTDAAQNQESEPQKP